MKNTTTAAGVAAVNRAKARAAQKAAQWEIDEIDRKIADLMKARGAAQTRQHEAIMAQVDAEMAYVAALATKAGS